MNLQKKFQEERYDRKYIENLSGYICYQSYDDGSLYVYELFVLPEKRKTSVGTLLEWKLIDKEKPRVIYCDVELKADNPEVALIAFMKRGYKIDQLLGDRIVLRKDIKDAKR